MNKQKKFFLALVFIFVTLFSSIAVSAQDSDKIFSKTRNTQEISELRTLYRDQIEAYRKSDKEFNIAKTNYFNLETLTSLENVVKATEVAMFDRSKVLITYLELLAVTLDDTAGIELSLKEKSAKQIRSLIVSLRLHQEDIILAKDRASVNLLADNFEVFVDSYNQITYQALSLIRIGQMRSVYDATTIIDSDIKSSQEGDEVGAVIDAKRNRAYQEIKRNFKIINDGLIKLDSKIIEEDDGFGRSFYERVLRDLEPIYVQISKSLDHLEELLSL